MSNPWYPFFPGDYARDTKHLSLQEHGAYRLLLDHLYSTEKPIPPMKGGIYRVCSAVTVEEQAAVDLVLEQFFILTADGWTNERANAQIEKQKAQKAKLSASGKKGVASREARRVASRGASSPEQAKPEPEPEPDIKPPPIKTEVPLTERMLREMVAEKREFIRTNYGLDDGEINIHLEEMVVKTRSSSPGPDLWLYVSRFLKNRKDDLYGRQRAGGGAAASGGKEKGVGTRTQGAQHGGVHAGQVRAGSLSGGFEDRSDEWGAGASV